LPFQEGSFDAAIAVHVFHLIGDARRAVQEVLRVLRPAGSLLICADMVEGTEQPSVSDKWREIVSRNGYAVPNSSEAASQLLDYLQSTVPGLVVETLKPVSWKATISHAEELDSIRRRLWSQTWRLPDEAFDLCFEELTAWYDTRFAGRADERTDCTKEFVIRKVTTPAQAG
jgi:SAM-dependent methyltransferase